MDDDVMWRGFAFGDPRPGIASVERVLLFEVAAGELDQGWIEIDEVKRSVPG